MNEKTLSGKVALVTGGNRGIGKSIALALASRGAQVFITGRDSNKLNETIKELQTISPKSSGQGCDVRSFEEQAEIFKKPCSGGKRKQH